MRGLVVVKEVHLSENCISVNSFYVKLLKLYSILSWLQIVLHFKKQPDSAGFDMNIKYVQSLTVSITG